MLLNIVFGVLAAAVVVLVAYVVPLVIQVRRAVRESEQLVARLNSELPSLLTELRIVAKNVNDLTETARDGVAHAAVFLHAVGNVGDTVQQVHSVVRGRGSNLFVNLASILAGFKAVTTVLKARMGKDQQEGGNSNVG